MHDIKWIRENPDKFDAALRQRRGAKSASELIALDDARRAAILAVEQAQEKRNAASKLIGQAKAQKDEAKAASLMAEVSALKEQLPALEAARKKAEDDLRNALLEVPNLPKDDVPEGADEEANVEYFGRNGSRDTAKAQRPPKPTFGFKPKEHFETGEALGEMDFEVAAKISGSRFVVLKSHLARLERAIGQFMLDLHVDEHGYTEVQPPYLVQDAVMYGTGQLPKFREDQYFFAVGKRSPLLEPEATRTQLVENDQLAAQFDVQMKDYETFLFDEMRSAAERLDFARTAMSREKDMIDLFRRAYRHFVSAYLDYEDQIAASRLWLIPTAEVPLTNLVRESIVAEEELPLRFTALTPCFRSEAGSAGRDTRGMIRQHQFNKVEMVAITTPETSADEHEKMLSDAEDVMKRLGLNYRVMTLSTGDMGFGAQKTYDIEVWLPGQDRYREISSVSVCGDFQARRMEAQYRPKGMEKGKGPLPYVHTLNGSGVAVGRALIAVMENYQQEDGSIAIPEVLQPYMKGLKSIGARS